MILYNHLLTKVNKIVFFDSIIRIAADGFIYSGVATFCRYFTFVYFLFSGVSAKAQLRRGIYSKLIK